MNFYERKRKLAENLINRKGFNVTLQVLNEGNSTDDGGIAEGYQNVATVKIALRAMTAGERLSNKQLHSKATYVATIPYRDDLGDTENASNHRLMHGQRIYSIYGATVVGDNVCLNLYVGEGGVYED